MGWQSWGRAGCPCQPHCSFWQPVHPTEALSPGSCGGMGLGDDHAWRHRGQLGAEPGAQGRLSGARAGKHLPGWVSEKHPGLAKTAERERAGERPREHVPPKEATCTHSNSDPPPSTPSAHQPHDPLQEGGNWAHPMGGPQRAVGQLHLEFRPQVWLVHCLYHTGQLPHEPRPKGSLLQVSTQWGEGDPSLAPTHAWQLIQMEGWQLNVGLQGCAQKSVCPSRCSLGTQVLP